MARAHSQYICQQCDYTSPKWLGRCPECGEWNSFVETVLNSASSKFSSSAEVQKPVSLSSIKSQRLSRLSTKLSELDRVFGGGLVPGQVVLLAGEPGIGKSTILLQLCQKVSKALYISGEESATQVKLRAQRLGIQNKNIHLLEETNVDNLVAALQPSALIPQPLVIVVDSIQTMHTSDLSGMAGSVGQVKESAFRLIKVAKKTHIPLILVGHVTKDGTVAGPATLAHLVDTVLWFEGDKTRDLRILRSIKNRFGPTDEIGIFTMQDKGLVPLEDENIFISTHDQKIPGSAITCTLEGTRPVIIEIQSLVIPSKMAFPKRVAQGIDPKRLEVILAVLARRCGLAVYEHDVFVNVAGGISIKEPAADFGIALSIASGFLNKPLPKRLLALGEVGLLGEIRSVTSEAKRLKQARRQGYTQVATAQQYPSLTLAVKSLLR